MADNVHSVKMHRKSEDLAGKAELRGANTFNCFMVGISEWE